MTGFPWRDSTLNRTLPHRSPDADPIAWAIRDGHIAQRDIEMTMFGTTDQLEQWVQTKAAIHAGAPALLSSADVARALQRGGLDRLARAWRARIDCAATRWWSVPATGRMHEVSANGRALLSAAEAGQ